MSYSSQFHMPGAYHFEANPASTSGGPGLNAGIFRPPMSPSASSSVLNLAKSTGSLCSDVSMANNNNTPSAHANAKRKRARDDPRRESTPLAADWTAADLSATAYDAETPLERNGDRPPRYVLAGQIETPGARTFNPLDANMDDSVYSDVDYRRALGSKKPHPRDPETPGVNGTAGGGRDLGATPQTPQSQGWGSFAFTVVGKVWDFCKGGAFRGFYAGGGKGYEWKGGDSTPPHAAAAAADGEDSHDPPWGSASDLPVGLNTPGAFPGAHYAPTPEYRDCSSPPASTPRPAAKRRQISENGDELRKNWVMVSEDDNDDEAHPPPPQQQQQQHLRPVAASRAEKKRPSLAPQPRPSSRQQARPAGPMRRISIPVSRLGGGGTPNAPPSGWRMPSSRISHAGSPGLTAREPASFAPPRSPVAASPSPSRRTFSPAALTSSSSRIPMSSGRGGAGSHSSANPFAPPRGCSASPRPSSRQSSMPSPSFGSSGTPGGGGGHRRAASTAGARRADAADPVSNSPRLDAEAQRLAARKRAVERDTDARMDAFSARLRDMIRQGKEALGTTVEVDGTAEDGGDEGWLDDE
ncbi:uncharacterized protein E0L32_007503 [Thyridium curvatum]|uniref:Uncharacterized protein n=1 Tax=Thyridium curvatum TaxID=1093900 RepID=A0A507AYB8_9PEZI|nr:uncharacterized protein E0L32_007503 [Thyridium curvatum]TPX11766.1 hypothetical protein E0L32_007503 [Thyridium curvatum]